VTAAANTSGSSRTATVTVSGGGLVRTVTVAQAAQQQVIVDPTPPEDGQGTIEISLEIPVSEQFSITFTVTLPAGFVLDPDATSLVSGLLSSYQLSVTPNGRGGWLFEITPRVSLRSGDETMYQQVVDIVYTLDNSVAAGNYEARINDVDLTLNGSGTTVHQDEIRVPIRVNSPSGIASVEAPEIVYANGVLTVHTPQAERIEVYSPGGALLYSARKASGTETFRIGHLSQGVVIVRGSSGWTRKVVI
jgi:hypothetical protein